MPLQGEGAVQGLLAATPNMIEGDLLKTERSQGQGGRASLPWPQGMEAEAGHGAGIREDCGQFSQGGSSGLSTQMDRGKAGQGPFS